MLSSLARAFLIILFFVAPAQESSGQDGCLVEIPLTVDGLITWDRFGDAVAVDGNDIVVGAPGIDSFPTPGAAYLFDVEDGRLVRVLTPPGVVDGDLLGYSVAVDDGVAVVSAPGADVGGSDGGAVWLIETATGAVLDVLTAPDTEANDRFGDAVAIDGAVVAIGARRAGATDAGQVYLFDVATSALLATLEAGAPEAFSGLGRAVDLDGDLVVAGAPFQGLSFGVASVLDRMTGLEVVQLAPEQPDTEARFGHAVAVQDGRVLVGAPTLGASGRVVIHDDAGIRLLEIMPPDPARQSWFGRAIDVREELVLVGSRAPIGRAGDGAAYLFRLFDGRPLRRLDRGGAGQDFGRAVALGRRLAVVGEPGNDAHGFYAGAAYLHRPCCDPDLDWSGAVDVSDLLMLLRSWGGCADCGPDLTDDGHVNVDDLDMLLERWGTCDTGESH